MAFVFNDSTMCVWNGFGYVGEGREEREERVLYTENKEQENQTLSLYITFTKKDRVSVSRRERC